VYPLSVTCAELAPSLTVIVQVTDENGDV